MFWLSFRKLLCHVRIIDIFAFSFLFFVISDSTYRKWSDPFYSHYKTILLAIFYYSSLIMVFYFELRSRKSNKQARPTDDSDA